MQSPSAFASALADDDAVVEMVDAPWVVGIQATQSGWCFFLFSIIYGIILPID
jgi:hypothetical protein